MRQLSMSSSVGIFLPHNPVSIRMWCSIELPITNRGCLWLFHNLACDILDMRFANLCLKSNEKVNYLLSPINIVQFLVVPAFWSKFSCDNFMNICFSSIHEELKAVAYTHYVGSVLTCILEYTVWAVVVQDIESCMLVFFMQVRTNERELKIIRVIFITTPTCTDWTKTSILPLSMLFLVYFLCDMDDLSYMVILSTICKMGECRRSMREAHVAVLWIYEFCPLA